MVFIGSINDDINNQLETKINTFWVEDKSIVKNIQEIKTVNNIKKEEEVYRGGGSFKSKMFDEHKMF